MTIEEAKEAVKAALHTGPASAVKSALHQYHSIQHEEEAAAEALYTAAVDIFTPTLGQMNL